MRVRGVRVCACVPACVCACVCVRVPACVVACAVCAGEECFMATKSILFRSNKVRRIYDGRTNSLIYVSYRCVLQCSTMRLLLIGQNGSKRTHNRPKFPMKMDLF
jgi:hypothetical protein